MRGSENATSVVLLGCFSVLFGCVGVFLGVLVFFGRFSVVKCYKMRKKALLKVWSFVAIRLCLKAFYDFFGLGGLPEGFR